MAGKRRLTDALLVQILRTLPREFTTAELQAAAGKVGFSLLTTLNWLQYRRTPPFIVQTGTRRTSIAGRPMLVYEKTLAGIAFAREFL